MIPVLMPHTCVSGLVRLKDFFSLSDVVVLRWQAIDAMERIRISSPSDGDVVTALARLYHRVDVRTSPKNPRRKSVLMPLT